jgi:hypothetical protein
MHGDGTCLFPEEAEPMDAKIHPTTVVELMQKYHQDGVGIFHEDFFLLVFFMVANFTLLALNMIATSELLMQSGVRT